MTGPPGLTGLVQDLRRAASWHRRLLVAGLTAAAVAFGISALAPAAPPTRSVLAAARDLPGGRPLAAGDLRAVALPPSAVPSGAFPPGAELLGRVLAGPVRRGEPLTDVRLVGPGLLGALGAERGPLVATPVRVADAGAAALLRAGDHVDVLATATGRLDTAAPPPVSRPVAVDVRVLSVPAGAAAGTGAAPAEGALVVLATTPEVAAELAAAAVTSRLSVTLRGR